MESIHYTVWQRPGLAGDVYLHVKPWITVSILPVLFICYFVYQVYLHPLAKYPGPLLAKLTILRAGYHAWKGDIHLDEWACHQKYGPIVRYGPDHILFDTSTGNKDTYGMGRNTWKHHNFAALNPRAANLVTMYDKKEHTRRRRLIGPAFTDTSIKRFEPKILHHLRVFSAQISAHQQPDGWSAPLKMSNWCAYLVFDIMTEFLFDSNYRLLESTEYRYVLHDIEDASARNAVLSYLPFLKIGNLDRKLFPEAVTGTRGFWRFMLKAMDIRAKGKPSGNDVFTYLTGAKDDQSGTTLDSQTIQSEAGILALAGLDTTTAAMAAFFFYLTRNPHAYYKLATEIRSSFPSADDIQLGSALHRCAYLHACIDEALRISPPIGSCPWREVGDGGEFIDGHFMAEGYSVGTAFYSLHHNPAYFLRPHEFIPERWIVADGDDAGKVDQVAAARAAFTPFSMGARGCIGRPLAYSELLLTAAMMIWKYDFRAGDGELGAGHPLGEQGRTNPMEFQILDRIMAIVEGPMIQFRLR